ncbi:Flp family type IVb pilin [Devosia riboflavina]
MKNALVLLEAFGGDEAGATAIEYALIGSLLSVVIIGALLSLNGTMVELFEHIRGFIVPALEGASS